MAVRKEFPAIVTPAQFVAVTSSLGAHIAAKLAEFGSDERTLTDDLCDMFCIWCTLPAAHAPATPAVPSGPPIPVLLKKTSQINEAVVGWDLSITVRNPQNMEKKSLLQAKVVDPDDGKLRIPNKEAWEHLREQLVRMRNHCVGELYYLLAYVSAADLDGTIHGYQSYEQVYRAGSVATATSSLYGASVIPGERLIDANEHWHVPRVRYTGTGNFNVPSKALAAFVIDLLICDEGQWSPAATETESVNPSLASRIDFTFDFAGGTEAPQWDSFLTELRSARKRLG